MAWYMGGNYSGAAISPDMKYVLAELMTAINDRERAIHRHSADVTSLTKPNSIEMQINLAASVGSISVGDTVELFGWEETSLNGEYVVTQAGTTTIRVAFLDALPSYSLTGFIDTYTHWFTNTGPKAFPSPGDLSGVSADLLGAYVSVMRVAIEQLIEYPMGGGGTFSNTTMEWRGWFLRDHAEPRACSSSAASGEATFVESGHLLDTDDTILFVEPKATPSACGVRVVEKIDADQFKTKHYSTDAPGSEYIDLEPFAEVSVVLSEGGHGSAWLTYSAGSVMPQSAVFEQIRQALESLDAVAFSPKICGNTVPDISYGSAERRQSDNFSTPAAAWADALAPGATIISGSGLGTLLKNGVNKAGAPLYYAETQDLFDLVYKFHSAVVSVDAIEAFLCAGVSSTKLGIAIDYECNGRTFGLHAGEEYIGPSGGAYYSYENYLVGFDAADLFIFGENIDVPTIDVTSSLATCPFSDPDGGSALVYGFANPDYNHTAGWPKPLLGGLVIVGVLGEEELTYG